MRSKVVITTLLVGTVLVAFFRFVLMPIQIVGDSMEPTYQDGQRHLLNRLAYVRQDPQRGDVVAFRHAGEIYIKRIVGLPGEVVDNRKGIIHIDGEPLQEPYAPFPWTIQPQRLGEEEYYIIGDNRRSTVFGPISRHKILGKVVSQEWFAR